MLRLVLIVTYFFIFPYDSNAKNNPSPTILKADKIDGSQQKNVINATGNVEVTKGTNVLKSDQLEYDKNKKLIKASGNVEIKGDGTGSIYSNKVEISDDFETGHLENAEIIFDDGSYVTSPKAERKSRSTSIFKNSIFSFCPNPEIVENNDIVKNDVGLITVRSKTTTIDKDDGSAKIRSGTLRIKKVPVFYTPYLSMPLQDAKRRSGFLHPSYTNTDNLGFGVEIPYYFNIAPNKDLTTTLQYHPSGKNFILNNKYRHLLKAGSYDIELEAANNNLLSATQDNSSSRGLLRSYAELDFKNNFGLQADVNYVSDKHYLRDYHNDYIGYSTSEINFDHIKNKDYNSAKVVKIQELETDVDSRTEINAIPVINSYFESKPGKHKETYSLLTNATVINRRSGLQYRRLSMAPEFVIPYNVSGNIFKFSTSVQGDLYSLDDNYSSTVKTTEFDHGVTSYRPQASISWNLPLIKKMKSSSVIIEPKVSLVTSSFSKNFNHLPNEDSSDTQLTYGNLFLKDRFVGFDRSESGERVNYGLTSNLFTNYGQFGLGLGQGYRQNNKGQDVAIKGFDNSKSNFVGEISYKTKKIFNIKYSFQLSESDYVNDVNELNTSVTFDNFNVYSNYILIRKTSTNSEKREQASIGINSKIYGNLKGNFSATKDLVTDRIIEKKIGVNYDGCCIIYGFSVSQYNPSQLIEAETSYNLNFSIKNL